MLVDEIITLLRQYKKGDEIQYFDGHLNKWCDCSDNLDYINTPEGASHILHVRIKPKDYYRPFESAEEVLEAMKEHGDWLRPKTHSVYRRPTTLNNSLIRFDDLTIGYKAAFESHAFADGTPFGKLIEK